MAASSGPSSCGALDTAQVAFSRVRCGAFAYSCRVAAKSLSPRSRPSVQGLHFDVCLVGKNCSVEMNLRGLADKQNGMKYSITLIALLKKFLVSLLKSIFLVFSFIRTRNLLVKIVKVGIH